MAQDFLSDIELYYSNTIHEEYIIVSEEEHHHLTNVMRHSAGDLIHVTDGKGKIFKAEISKQDKKKTELRIIEQLNYPNNFQHITFCLPRIKSIDRFEFALEKCVELGITNFIVFESDNSVAKGDKSERWNKLALSAMKQSLRSWLPTVRFIKSIPEILKLEGKKHIFDQSGAVSFKDILVNRIEENIIMNLFSDKCLFIFGPEGGFSSEEYRVLSEVLKIKLTGNRLRSETAIITAASLLSQTILK